MDGRGMVREALEEEEKESDTMGEIRKECAEALKSLSRQEVLQGHFLSAGPQFSCI
jgi:hypothetical protein